MDSSKLTRMPWDRVLSRISFHSRGAAMNRKRVIAILSTLAFAPAAFGDYAACGVIQPGEK